jgi:hypothetical protein
MEKYAIKSFPKKIHYGDFCVRIILQFFARGGGGILYLAIYSCR